MNYTPKPAPAPTQAAATSPLNLKGDTGPIAAGGALALLALGGAAAAVSSRRRKRREQEWADAQTMSYDSFESTAPASPEAEPVRDAIREERPAELAVTPTASAFAWGNPPANRSAPANQSSVDEDDRMPGETWVQRAYRGPTPNNPSVSLRNRLKRAAFFDKREREAAAGLAVPVDPTAGLPEAAVEERERQLA